MNITVSYEQIGHYIERELLGSSFSSADRIEVCLVDHKTVKIRLKEHEPSPFVLQDPAPLPFPFSIVKKVLFGSEKIWIHIDTCKNNMIWLSYECSSQVSRSLIDVFKTKSVIDIDTTTQKAVLHPMHIGEDVKKLLSNANIENISCNDNGVEVSLSFR